MQETLPLIVGAGHNSSEFYSAVDLIEKAKKQIKTVGIEATSRDLENFRIASESGIHEFQESDLEKIFGGIERVHEFAVSHRTTVTALLKGITAEYNFNYGIFKWAIKTGRKIIPLGYTTRQKEKAIQIVMRTERASAEYAKLIFDHALQERRILSNIKRKKPDAVVVSAFRAQGLSETLHTQPQFTSVVAQRMAEGNTMMLRKTTARLWERARKNKPKPRQRMPLQRIRI